MSWAEVGKLTLHDVAIIDEEFARIPPVRVMIGGYFGLPEQSFSDFKKRLGV